MYEFKTVTGKITIEDNNCIECSEKPCINACAFHILKETNGKPTLAIDENEVEKGRCIECLACELECSFKGREALHIVLPLPEVN